MSYKYETPLCKRYASDVMQKLFSDDTKFSTWRKLWIALAQAQRELGLDITQEQIAEMQEHIYDIDYAMAAKFERETRHDVMAHIKTFGEKCPTAKPIIHLGATSCYVGDNADLIIQRQALVQVKQLLLSAIGALYAFAERHKALPCLAYTHFQAAQPTTLGKRASLWLHDLLLDLEVLDFTIDRMKLLGCRGTTGTSASFFSLFGGDGEKARLLERKIADAMGFEDCYPVSGQTYSRKVDYYILSVLSGIAQSACKFSNDIRLMCHMKEVDEPFESGQVGSSAMAYKRNPMRSERIAALARYVMVDTLNPAITASAQWLERTLDDSANRRIAIPEAFLATDAILSLMINIVGGMTVYPKVIAKHLEEELPFMATENILMQCVKKGGDRGDLHERIRQHSQGAAGQVKLHGLRNDLIARLQSDAAFDLTVDEWSELLQPEQFIGLAVEQTEAFLCQVKEVLASAGVSQPVEIDIKV
ncbi:MAG: adenylosuccinate lyase [Oscillospiraceae bacterium]|nr:adenylosuccinate lyase [Oscillospiraceae bacterium]